MYLCVCVGVYHTGAGTCRGQKVLDPLKLGLKACTSFPGFEPYSNKLLHELPSFHGRFLSVCGCCSLRESIRKIFLRGRMSRKCTGMSWDTAYYEAGLKDPDLEWEFLGKFGHTTDRSVLQLPGKQITLTIGLQDSHAIKTKLLDACELLILGHSQIQKMTN